MSTEVEYKFVVEDLRQINQLSLSSSWLTWQSDRPGKKFHIHGEYFDTEERLLDRELAVLRLRREGERRVMTLKYPESKTKLATDSAKGFFNRVEISAELPKDFEIPPVELFAKQHPDFWSQLPAAIAAALRQPLRRYYVIDFARQQRYLINGDSEIELCLDQGFFRSQSGIEQPFLEAEFELISGTVTDLKELVDHVREKFGLTPQPMSKYESCVALDQA